MKTAVDSNKYDQLLEANRVLKKETLEGWVEDFWDLPGSFIPVLRENPYTMVSFRILVTRTEWVLQSTIF